jgi:hypothetical protein
MRSCSDSPRLNGFFDYEVPTSTTTWGISRDAVSRLNALTGGYDRTRDDEYGTIGYELRFFR